MEQEKGNDSRGRQTTSNIASPLGALGKRREADMLTTVDQRGRGVGEGKGSLTCLGFC